MLNDGGFKPKDKQAIKSFGLNGKAADDGAIGKFGLGMKSVFHLCESFFTLPSTDRTSTSEIPSSMVRDENTLIPTSDGADQRSGSHETLAVARHQDLATAIRGSCFGAALGSMTILPS